MPRMQNAVDGGRANTTVNSNVVFGDFAGATLNGAAVGNVFIGNRAGQNVSSGSSNTFVGTSINQGGGNPSAGVAIGVNAMFAGGDHVNCVAIGNGAGAVYASGKVGNIALGGASQPQMTDSNYCVGIGYFAQGNPLAFGNFSTGDGNIGIGANTQLYLASGIGNTHVGTSSGGAGALSAGLTGDYNVGIGYQSHSLIDSGSGNSALGRLSGSAYTSEDDNVTIANIGVAADAGVIRIGTAGTQTSAFITGITGVTVTGVPVLVSSGDQLGIAVSSAKFKENINDMASLSEVLYKLRPVTFNYKKDESQSICVGLIAEEVEQVYSNLVAYDKVGQPMSVKYQDLVPLLLNEVQKLKKCIDKLEGK